MSDRILHVLWSLEVGGAERALFQLAAEQRRRGIEADVAVATTAGFYGDRIREAGATVHELHLRRGFDAASARRARTLFARYDVIHFHAAEPTLASAAATVRSRKYYTHRAGGSHYPFKQSMRYRVMGAVVRHSFTGLSANTLHAAAAASRVLRVPRSEILTTYNGIDFALLRPSRPRDNVTRELGAPRDATLVATAANLRPIKRVDLLIEAIAATRGDIHCYIIGDGPDRPRLEALADSFRCAERVSFLGSRTHVADYLQVMDAFVLPTGPEESFGNAAVEAMGVGLPTVVFNDGGGLLEHIDDGKTGFVVRDPAQLALTLEALAYDSELRQRIGQAGAATVRSRYTLDQMLEAYAHLYDKRN